MKHKSDIPEVITDYCIDNKMTIKDGLTAMIEEKFATIDRGIKDLKKDVTDKLIDALEEDAFKLTDRDMSDIESYLDFLNRKNNEDKDNA